MYALDYIRSPLLALNPLPNIIYQKNQCIVCTVFCHRTYEMRLLQNVLTRILITRVLDNSKREENLPKTTRNRGEIRLRDWEREKQKYFYVKKKKKLKKNRVCASHDPPTSPIMVHVKSTLYYIIVSVRPYVYIITRLIRTVREIKIKSRRALYWYYYYFFFVGYTYEHTILCSTKKTILQDAYRGVIAAGTRVHLA